MTDVGVGVSTHAFGTKAKSFADSTEQTLSGATLELSELSAELIISSEPSAGEPHLIFWAIQGTFFNASGTQLGGAHAGLQWIPSHPNNHAVNFGGYDDVNGGELTGTTSQFPSATGNVNTRDYNWAIGAGYVFRMWISAPGEVSCSINGALIRTLFVPNVYRIGSPVYWVEDFRGSESEATVAHWRNLRLAKLDGGSLWVSEIYRNYGTGFENRDLSVVGGNEMRFTHPGTRVGAHGTYVTLTAPSTVISDSFNRSDSTSLGPNWSERSFGGGSVSSISISNNRLSFGESGIRTAVHQTALATSDQWAQVTIPVKPTSTSQWGGVAVRQSPTGVGGYVCLVNLDSIRLYSQSSFTISSIVIQAHDTAAGDVVRIEAEGSTVRVLVNNNVVITRSVPVGSEPFWDGSGTYKHAGACGGSTGFAVDDFSAGDISVVATPATVPAAPSDLRATAENTQVSLSWTAPDDGGSAIADYIVEYDSGSGFVVFADGVSTATTATVTGLTNGVLHSFRVAALNAVGTSAYSTTVTATPAVLTHDNFDRPDSTDLGSNWSERLLGGSSTTTMEISNNRLLFQAGTSTLPVLDRWAVWQNPIDSVDQWVEVTVPIPPPDTNHFVGAALRMNSSGVGGYICAYNATSIRLYVTSGSTITRLTLDYFDELGVTLQAGDRLRVAITGSILTASLNGVGLATITDTTWDGSGGQVYVAVAGNAGMYVDNFATAASLVTNPTPTETLLRYIKINGVLVGPCPQYVSLDSVSPPPPPPSNPEERSITPGAYGNPWYMNSLANLNIDENSAYGYRFKAPRSGNITAFRTYWIDTPGYASGNGGEILCELRPDNGSGMPDFSAAALASYTKTFPTMVDGTISPRQTADKNAHLFTLMTFTSSAAVVGGTTYHVTMRNIAGDAANNNVSIDMAMIYSPATGSRIPSVMPSVNDWGMTSFNPTTTPPSGAADYTFHPTSNARYVPILEFHYDDAIVVGQGYIDGWPSYGRPVNATNRVREQFTPAVSHTIATIDVMLEDVGGTGTVTIALKDSGGAVIHSINVAATEWTTTSERPVWVSKAFPVTLTGGAVHYLEISTADASLIAYAQNDGASNGNGWSSQVVWSSASAQSSSNSGSTWNGWHRDLTDTAFVHGDLPIVFMEPTEVLFPITDYGASTGATASTNTVAINDAIAAAEAAGPSSVVVIPAGTFTVDGQLYNSPNNNRIFDGPGAIRVRNNTHIRFEAGALLQIASNSLTHYCAILNDGKTGVLIEGPGTIRGDWDTHTDLGGEFGYGIEAWGSFEMTVRDLTLTNCWGDGISLVVGSTGRGTAAFTNLTANYNRRLGGSVIGACDLTSTDCHWDNNGTSLNSLNGVGPAGGFDIEPEWNVTVNATFTRDTFNNNRDRGFHSIIPAHVSGTTGNVLTTSFVDCDFNGNGIYGIDHGTGSHITVDAACTISNNAKHGIRCAKQGGAGTRAGTLNVGAATFTQNGSSAFGDGHLFVAHWGTSDTLNINGATLTGTSDVSMWLLEVVDPNIDNCSIRNDGARSLFLLGDGSEFATGVSVTGCTLDRGSGPTAWGAYIYTGSTATHLDNTYLNGTEGSFWTYA